MSDTRDVDEVLRRLGGVPPIAPVTEQAAPLSPSEPLAALTGRGDQQRPFHNGRLPSGTSRAGAAMARRSLGTSISVVSAIVLMTMAWASRNLSDDLLSSASQTRDLFIVAKPSRPTASSDVAARAASGDAAAQYDLGMNYARGGGASKDMDAAAHWLGLAAASGVADAQFALGALKAKLAPDDDGAEVTALYLRAAQQDNAKAQYNLALAYADGVGVPQSYRTAIQWFERAALGGIGDAAFNLGMLHAKGVGVAASPVEAFAWFTIAAQSGVSDSASRSSLLGASLTPADRQLAEARIAELAGRIRGRTTTAAATTMSRIGELISITTAQAEPAAPLARIPAVPEAAAAAPTPALIEACQRLLTVAHYEPGPANGVLTSRTAEAIRKFQSVQHLTVDGQPSQALLVVLRREATPLKPAG